jgi:hypothetical protein
MGIAKVVPEAFIPGQRASAMLSEQSLEASEGQPHRSKRCELISHASILQEQRLISQCVIVTRAASLS